MFGFRLHLPAFIEAGHPLPNLVLDAPCSCCSVDNPDNSLIESILLFKGLFPASSLPVRAVESRSSSELWNCSCGICSLLSVLCWTTGIHHFVSESNLRLLDCFVLSHLNCGLCLRVVTRSSTILLVNCGWRTRLSSASFVCVHVGPASSLATVSLPKSTVAHAHRRSVRRFNLA